jgi:hypothetical protein
MIHRTPKGYNNNRALSYVQFKKSSSWNYKINGDLYSRKELQRIKGDVVKLPENLSKKASNNQQKDTVKQLIIQI